MASGALDIEIQQLLPLLGTEEKQSLLSVIRSFLSLKKQEGSHDIDIAQYNQDIDDAMTRINKGEFTTHEDLRKEMETW